MESSTLAVSTTSTEAVLDGRCPAVFNVLHAPTTAADRRLCLDDNDNDGRLQQQLMRDDDDEEDEEEEEMAEEERLLMVLSEVRRAYSLLCDNVYGNGDSEFIRRLESYSNTPRSNAHDCINCSQCPVTCAPVSRPSPPIAAVAAALGLHRHIDAINHNDFLGLQSTSPAMSRDLSTQSDIYSSCSDRFVFSELSRQGVFRSDSTSPSIHASNSTPCCTQTLHDPRRPTAMRCCRSVSVPPFLRPIEEEEWSSGGEETAGGPNGRVGRSLRPGSIAGFSSSSNADDFARNEYYLTYNAAAASVGHVDAASTAESVCPCGGLATVCLCPEPAEQLPQLELGSLASSSTDDTITSHLDTASTNSIDVTVTHKQHSTTSGSGDDQMMTVTSPPTTCDVSESSNKEKLYNASLTGNNSVARVGRSATNSTSEMTSEAAKSPQDVESDHTPHSLWLDDQQHLFYVLLTTSASFVACLTALPPSCLVTLVAFVSLIGFRTARL